MLNHVAAVSFKFLWVVLLLPAIILVRGENDIASVANPGQDGPVSQFIPEDTVCVRLVFAGDVMGHMVFINSGLDSAGNYCFDSSFQYIKPIIEHADFSIANLETTLAGAPYTGYPQFSSPDAIAVSLKHIGFDALVMANNHCLDRGKSGLIRTLNVLDSLQFKHTGVFRDYAEEKPIILEKQNLRIAIFNATYGTNGIPVTPPNHINYIQPDSIIQDITRLTFDTSTFVIGFVHWGNEYERYPCSMQQSLATTLIRNGCDLIIGAHPHVIQPIEFLKPDTASGYSVPVYYSLGNFISNQRDRYRDGGILAEVSVRKIGNRSPKIISVGYVPFWVYKGVIKGRYNFYLIPSSIDPAIIKDLPKDAQLRFNEFVAETKLLLSGTN